MSVNALALFALLVAPVAATLLHELTHYVLASVLFVDARIIRPEPWRLAVEYDIFDEPVHHKLSRIVNLSPGIVGVAAWTAAYAFGWLPALSVETGWLYAGSLLYIVGGPGDYL
jgi:hypothetical protein